MPSRETQALILKVALHLFNEHRSAAVSTNRIAEACEIVKGISITIFEPSKTLFSRYLPTSPSK